MEQPPIVSASLAMMLLVFGPQGGGLEQLTPRPTPEVAACAGDHVAASSVATDQDAPSGTAAQDQRPTVRPRPADEANAAAPGEYVHFPAAGVKIRRPEGFEKADSFDGFGQPETKSSVMATNIPGPAAKITEGFTAKSMKARGWKLRSREEVKIDGQAGILVHFEQPVGDVVFLKWGLAFGDDRGTTLVTATLPADRERELSARLKAAVLSVRPDGAPAMDTGSELPFTVVKSPKLEPAKSINRTLLFTKDGTITANSPKSPLFIAAGSLGRVEVGDKREFAERRLLGVANVKRLDLKSTEAITVDKIGGYESLAEAEDAGTGTPLTVYQVILFGEGSYILMQGLVGSEFRDEYLPEFKAMARSLRRKNP